MSRQKTDAVSSPGASTAVDDLSRLPSSHLCLSVISEKTKDSREIHCRISRLRTTGRNESSTPNRNGGSCQTNARGTLLLSALRGNPKICRSHNRRCEIQLARKRRIQKTERSQAVSEVRPRTRVKYKKAPGKTCLHSYPTGTFHLTLTQI